MYSVQPFVWESSFASIHSMFRLSGLHLCTLSLLLISSTVAVCSSEEATCFWKYSISLFSFIHFLHWSATVPWACFAWQDSVVEKKKTLKQWLGINHVSIVTDFACSFFILRFHHFFLLPNHSYGPFHHEIRAFFSFSRTWFSLTWTGMHQGLYPGKQGKGCTHLGAVTSFTLSKLLDAPPYPILCGLFNPQSINFCFICS